MLRAILVATLLGVCAPAWAAPDIVGIWQGKALSPHVLKVIRAKGKLTATYINVDGADPAEHPASSIRLDGTHFTFTMNLGCATDRPDGECLYLGEMAPDGKSITGTWQTLGKPVPMTLNRVTKAEEWPAESAPHKLQFITVDKGVKLEVIDWGGSGAPLVFLPGLNATAHTFDKFAPKFTDHYHVYGITRRGYGASSMADPATADYSSDRLGDDVVAVLDALKLQHPVLAGWSLGGEELSSVGNRHPDRVAGLIYLDAGYPYAFYAPGYVGNPAGYNIFIQANVLKADIAEFQALGPSHDPLGTMTHARPLLERMQKDLADFQKDVTAVQGVLMPPGWPSDPPHKPGPQERIADAIYAGAHRYGAMPMPILAIYAVPKPAPPSNASEFDRHAAMIGDEGSEQQADAFAAAMPQARVVKIANAQHAVWASNEAQVMQEMNAFLAKLPKQ